MQCAIYIIADKPFGTLYIGVTSDLVGRIWRHKENLVEGFSKRYRLHNLVYYELTESIESAISREKQLKNWKRQWKIELVSKFNPEWKDLYDGIIKV
jgi:putative endonuclease